VNFLKAVIFLTFLTYLVGATGCYDSGLSTAQQNGQSALQHSLLFAAPWSEAINGICCRVRLASREARETQTIVAAMELWNVSSGAIEVNTDASQLERYTIWRLEGELFTWDPIDAKNLPEKPVRFAPGKKFLIGPAHLRITPSVGPRALTQQLSASTMIGKMIVVTPPAVLSVEPAQWGAISNGLRLCIGCDRETISSGDPLSIALYLHNVTNDRMALLTPDWSHPFVQSNDDEITLTYRIPEGAGMTPQAPRSVQRRMLDLGNLLDRPGIYRVRVVLDAPPTRLVPKQAWTGSAVSNELTLHVENVEIAPNPASTGSTAPHSNR
jgi:hypothetical protein